MRHAIKLLIPVAMSALLAGQAAALESPPGRQPAAESGGLREAMVNVGSQPARDLGMAKREIPVVLQKAADAPYDRTGLDSCEAVAAERAALDEALGPDLDGSTPVRENMGAKLAEAGGRTLINSIIPFRGLIREISGAAPADRRLEMLVDAGHARRGFLRGMEAKLECGIPVISVASLSSPLTPGASN